MIRDFLEWILELVYPTRAQCLGCGDILGTDEPFLCPVCRKLFKPVDVVGKREEWTERGLEYAAFAHYYGRPVKGLIRSYKFKSVHMLAGILAQELINMAEHRQLGPYDMVVPVPLHPTRLRKRGYNQAELLAGPLAEALGVPLRTDVLGRRKKTKQQSKLSVRKRGANLADAFMAVRDLTGMRILLVDDVVTTGSTLCACAEALKSAGATSVSAAALAGSYAWKRGRKKVYRLKKKFEEK